MKFMPATILPSFISPMRSSASGGQEHEQKVFGRTLIPITPPVLRAAARLRRSITSLRTPDALHAATAKTMSAATLMTNDKGFRGVEGLPITILDEVLAI